MRTAKELATDLDDMLLRLPDGNRDKPLLREVREKLLEHEGHLMVRMDNMKEFLDPKISFADYLKT